MKYLKVDDYAKRTGITHQAVYKKIKSGELQTTKKSVSGRLVTFIEIDEVEPEFNEVAQPYEQNNLLQAEHVESPINMSNNSEYLELIKQMYEDNRSLAELAGQTKLLTDSENRTKEEYFRIVSEHSELKAKLSLKEEQLRHLQEKLERQSIGYWLKKL